MTYEYSKICEAYSSILDENVPNLQWLSDKFDEFNKSMFNGKLSRPKFEIPTAESDQFGETESRYSKYGKTFSNYIIRISNRQILPTPLLEDVLLHEMIHLENMQLYPMQLLKNGKPNRRIQHSTDCFKNEMKRINKNFKRHVRKSISLNSYKSMRLGKDDILQMENEIKNTIFYCVHVDGISVFVYKLHKDDATAAESIKNLYKNCNIEALEPINSKSGLMKFSKNIRHRYIMREGDDFEGFKNELLSKLTESSQNASSIEDVIASDGCDDAIFFDEGDTIRCIYP